MKNQKGFIVPLLIGIIALLVIGGGAYVYQNKKAKAPASIDTTQTDNSKVSENTIPIQNDNSNWKTYKNTKYGFEFKHPADWTFQENDPYGWVVRKDPDYSFYLDVMNYPYAGGIEQGINSNNGKKLILIDNHKALIGDAENSVFAEIETVSYSRSSHLITLSMDSNNQSKDMKKIFSTILSTFKFTN